MSSAPLRRAEPIWGTVITVDVRDAVAPPVVDGLFDWFRRVDELFSTWRLGSEISRLGRGEVDRRELSAEVREVLDRCEAMRAATWGAFDVNVGADPRVVPREGLGPIDPSGLVKGWALDRAGAMLRKTGVVNFAINAGGDVLVSGEGEPGQLWRVGIQHPTERDAVSGVVVVTDCGVATSGRYERGDHVLDPRTGRPAVALLSASVVAPELAVADGLATGLLALGPDAERWLGAHPDIAAQVIDVDGVALSTAAFHRLRVNEVGG
jgi:thiamine biosynthesis lipoprotein